MEIKNFCVKAYKSRIATIQYTVNHDLVEVDGTCGRAYIAWITDVATSNSDACTIGIFLLRSDLTHNHGVENFFSSVSGDIFKYNDTEGVRSLHALVPGSL